MEIQICLWEERGFPDKLENKSSFSWVVCQDAYQLEALEEVAKWEEVKWGVAKWEEVKWEAAMWVVGLLEVLEQVCEWKKINKIQFQVQFNLSGALKMLSENVIAFESGSKLLSRLIKLQ